MSLIARVIRRLVRKYFGGKPTLQVDHRMAMQKALDISGNHVMCLDLRKNCVYDLHGKALFGNNVGIDVCYTYIHEADRPAFKNFIERLSQGIDKEAECRYRWDYNYTGTGEPEWHDMHSYAIAEYASDRQRPVNIIATLTDETELLRKQRQARQLSERYGLIFENSIIGLSFYTPEGKLLRANRIMREICHFDSDDGDSFFSKVNLFDIPPFNEVMDRNHLDDFWGCTQSIIPERDMHVYLEIRVCPVRNANGDIVYISVATRDITEEREMYRQAKHNDIQLQRFNDEIQLYEAELRYMLEACDMRVWRVSLADRTIRFYKGLSTVEREMSLDELNTYFIQDEQHPVSPIDNATEFFAKSSTGVYQTRSIFHEKDTQQWNQINTIPVYDEHGRLTGGFGLIRNVTSLMQKQNQLRRETERANESGHTKSVFLANMTHEIRTPLNAIVGFSDVLTMLDSADEKQEIIRVIMKNCDMLLRLINDILVASSLESNGVEIVPHEVDFAKSFNDLFESLRPRVDQPGVELVKDSPYDRCVVTIDEGRVNQVITNFLTNAVKYTHQGHIRLGYQLEQRDGRDGLYVYCEDTGEGIPAEVQDKIFERFFKVNDFIQGSGLGLSICKAIADACKGSIGVRSDGKNSGSTFWMWIPTCVRTLLLCLLLGFNLHFNVPAATAQPAFHSREYTSEHPLVYEDTWDLWPYVFLDENGKAVGYNIDLLHLLCGELKIPYIVKLKPTSSALEDLKAGHSDLMFGMDAHFHNDYAHYGRNVIQIFTHSEVYHRDNAPAIASVSDLSTHKVIVHDGSFSHHLMQRRGWGHNAIPYDDMKEAVQYVYSEPASRIIWNTMSLKWLIQTLHYDNQLKLSPVKMAHGEYRFMSNDSLLLARLDSVFSKLNSSGQLQAIQNKWFYPERRDSGIPGWIWRLAVALVLLLLVSIAYYLVYRRQEKLMTREIRRSNSRLALILRTSGVHIWILHVATKTVSQYTGSGEELEEQSLRDFLQQVHPQDRRHIVAALNDIAACRQDQQTLDVVALNADGDFSRTLTIGLDVLHRGKDGRPTDIIGITSDVTADHLRLLQVKRNMLLYQSVFNSAMVDSITYDEHGYMSDMNETASRAFPGGKEGAQKKRFCLADVLGSDMPPIDELQTTYLTRMYTVGRDERVFNSALHDSVMYYELQLVPVRNAQGRLLTVFGTGRDVTEMVHSYQQLQRNVEQMERLNGDLCKYIANIDFVLKNGGVRMVRYSPQEHVLRVYSAVDQVQDELTQTRALAVVDADSKRAARRLLTAMDNQNRSTLTATIKTELHTEKGLPLYLYFSFVPTTDADGSITGYFGMARDISDIKAAEEQLARETAKAQEVETVKSSFLRNMSYEIRTPLNSVVGFAELFAMEHAPEDEQFFINEIKENSAHLLKLINDILFLSRLDAHMIEFKRQSVNLADTFVARCQVAWYNHQHDGVDFVVDNAYKSLVVDIDEQNLGVVIDQLVTNSAEHTRSGQIRISYDYNGAELNIAFQDTGEGISDERLKQIFQRFGSTGGKGTGLGLPICHEIIHQMGGHIRIKSEEGKGTIVWVTIPCRCTEIVRN